MGRLCQYHPKWNNNRFEIHQLHPCGACMNTCPVSAKRRPVSYGATYSGPSASADIEGVLFHGAQGVRSPTIILGA
jgi:ferredoxin